MFFSKRLRLTFAAGLLSTAAMACGGAPDLNKPAPAVKQNGITFSAKASAKSVSALHVTRWHSTVEHGANGAIVLDGQDRAGRVKYLQTAFIDKKSHTMHVQVILPQKGEIVWDIKSLKVLSNTIPSSVQPFAKGIYHDWQIGHSLRGGTQAYSALSGATQIAGGAVLVVAGGFVDATVIGIPVGGTMQAIGTGLIASGIKDVVDAAGTSAPAAAPGGSITVNGNGNTVTAPPGANVTVNGDNNVINSAGEVKAAVDAANPGASPTPNEVVASGFDAVGAPAAPGTDPANPANPAAPGAPADPAAPGADPTAATTGAPAKADPAGAATDGSALPDASADGNLDNVGAPAPVVDNSGGDAPVDNSGAAPVVDNSGGDAPADNSGGGGAADNSGGGGDSSGAAQSAHVCRKVAVSATSKIRACVHY